MKKLVFVGLLFFTLILNSFESKALITSFFADSALQVAYNGYPQDSVFVFCSDGPNNIGQLIGYTPNGSGSYQYIWTKFNATALAYQPYSSTTHPGPDTLNNLQAGGYKLKIFQGGNLVDSATAWVYIVNLSVSINTPSILPNTCNPNTLTLHGSKNINTTNFEYYGPLPPSFIVNNTTEITVCFDAVHTFVSDLGFYLVGPASCGSPTVALAPNSGSIGGPGVCNSGDDINNLCFSTTSTANFEICSAPTPLTGTFGTYGQNPPGQTINWNVINGCNVGSPGWRVQIYDCIGADVGALTGATITFFDPASGNTINYNSGTINSFIADNSCSPNTASIYQVPITLNSYTITNSASHVWSSNNPNVTLSNPTTTMNPSVTPIPMVDTEFYLTVFDEFGCSKTDTFLYIAHPPIVVDSVNITNPSCFGDTNGVVDVFISGGIPPFQVKLGSSPFGSSTTFTGLTGGTYTLLIIDSVNCVKTQPVVVNNPSQLQIVTDTIAPVTCFGLSDGYFELSTTGGTGPTTYLWNTNDTSANLYNLSAGNYSVTVTDSNLCTDTGVFQLTQPSAITIAVSNDTTICLSNSRDLKATVSGGTAPFTYYWNQGLSNDSNQTVSPLTTTSYTVYAVDTFNCTTPTVQSTIYIRPELSQSLMNDTTVCKNDSFLISTKAFGGDSIYGYIFNGINSSSRYFQTAVENDSLFQVIAFDACGSPTDTDSVWVFIENVPFIPLETPFDSACVPFNYVVNVDTQYTNTYYNWYLSSFNPFLQDFSGSNQNYISIPGCYDLIVEAVTSLGCTTEQIEPCIITALDNPIADFTHYPDSPSFDDPYINFTNLSINATEYLWFVNGLNTSKQQDMRYEVTRTQENTEVFLIAIDQFGCRDTLINYYDFTFDFSIYFPNVFTPNGDGLNDVFLPIGTNISEEYYILEIYNRWGEQVFISTNPSIGWDGTFKGQVAQTGIYNYKLTYIIESGIQEKFGTFSLLMLEK